MDAQASWVGCQVAVQNSTKLPKKNRADETIPPAHSFPSLSNVENPEVKVVGLFSKEITIYGDFARF
jgi:hypothetical protein